MINSIMALRGVVRSYLGSTHQDDASSWVFQDLGIDKCNWQVRAQSPNSCSSLKKHEAIKKILCLNKIINVDFIKTC